MARRWRVYQPGMVGEVGRQVELSTDEAHHVARVLRLAAGEPISLFDGDGDEWDATLLECGSRSVSARLDARRLDAVESPLRLSLVQGLSRSERIDWVVQKATEIGAGDIWLLASARSESSRPASRRIERWKKIAVEACKQSGRRRVPEIRVVREMPHPQDSGALALLLDPHGAARPISELLAGNRPTAIWLAVGPEGGFAEEELAEWAAVGWHRVGLGPRILRTETAGLVAAALVLHRWSDLGSTPAG